MDRYRYIDRKIDSYIHIYLILKFSYYIQCTPVDTRGGDGSEYINLCIYIYLSIDIYLTFYLYIHILPYTHIYDPRLSGAHVHSD